MAPLSRSWTQRQATQSKVSILPSFKQPKAYATTNKASAERQSTKTEGQQIKLCHKTDNNFINSLMQSTCTLNTVTNTVYRRIYNHVNGMALLLPAHFHEAVRRCSCKPVIACFQQVCHIKAATMWYDMCRDFIPHRGVLCTLSATADTKTEQSLLLRGVFPVWLVWLLKVTHKIGANHIIVTRPLDMLCASNIYHIYLVNV